MGWFTGFIGLGVHVGENAIVGATASVYKSVDANTIVGEIRRKC